MHPKESASLSRRKFLQNVPAGFLTLCAGILSFTTQQAQALPHDRRVARRTARRTTRRVSRRRYFWGLPSGAVPYAYGGYRYFVAGGLYYYPYMFSGRTVYVQVDVSGGRPLPPPPASEIRVDIDL